MSEENPDDVEPVDDERVGFSEEVFGEEFNIGWICKGLRRKDILRLFFENILMRFTWSGRRMCRSSTEVSFRSENWSL